MMFVGGSSMTRVKVKYYSVFKKITDKSQEKIKVDDNATIEDLLKKLTEVYGEDFFNYIFRENNKIQPTSRISINGEIVTSTDLDNKIKDGDKVLFFTPMSGG